MKTSRLTPTLLAFSICLLPLAGLQAQFVPDDIASLRLWLDATDASTLTLDEGSVTAWADKSSNEATFTVAGTPSAIGSPTVNANGIGGLNSVAFAGVQGLRSDTRLNFMHNGTGFTTFFVYEIDSQDPNAYHPLLSTGGLSGGGIGILMRVHQLSAEDSYNFFLSQGESPQLSMKLGGNTLDLAASIVQQTYSFSDGTNSSSAWQNGDFLETRTNSTVVPQAGDSTDLPSIGYHATYFPDNFTFHGLISEMLVYEGVLTEEQQQQVGFYLAEKYDLETSYVPEPAATALAFASIILLMCLLRKRTRTA